LYTRAGQSQPARFSIDRPDGHIQLAQSVVIRAYTFIAEDILRIPIHVVLSDPEIGNYVYVNVQGSKQQQTVELGLNNGVWVEVRTARSEWDDIYIMLEEGTELFVP
jgi:hypothetical protein